MSAKNLFDLSGRVAIITGVAGLGRSMARGFADFGAAVVCADIDPNVAKETAELVKQAGREALNVQCDVTSQKDVDTLVARTLEKFGDIDILVNSAGITKHVPPSDFLMEDWMHIIDVNLKGTFLCCQAVGRHHPRASGDEHTPRRCRELRDADLRAKPPPARAARH